MHQKRNELTKKIPVPRKGTKYVVRALSHLKESVPVVIAVRDMLKLARTTKEVKLMIHNKALKLNGKEVKDFRGSIKLFNILEAGKHYVLTLTENGKYKFEETKNKTRAVKIIGKKIVKGNKIQLNLHDGTNILSKDKVNIYDTLYIDEKNKIVKHLPLEKDTKILTIFGKYAGKKGEIESLKNGTVKVKFSDKTAELEKQRIIAL